jgi:DNA (cytosine-5)-methyltransferase 1
MRMLTPRELYNAQGFPPGYVIDGAWDYHDGGAGPVWRSFSKSVQVSCVGNSVCPPVACALVAANCNHLAVQRAAA